RKRKRLRRRRRGSGDEARSCETEGEGRNAAAKKVTKMDGVREMKKWRRGWRKKREKMNKSRGNDGEREDEKWVSTQRGDIYNRMMDGGNKSTTNQQPTGMRRKR
ncbi:unnamed protein product, partial [Arctogadus glacialis]